MPSKTPLKTRETVVQMKEAGKTYAAIREATGLKSDATVCKILREAGMARKNEPPKPTGRGLSAFEIPAAPEPVPAETWECPCGAEFDEKPGDDDECGNCGAVF